MAILHGKQGLLCDKNNSIPNNKILHQSKFKVLVGSNTNVTERFKFVTGKKNVVGKQFLLFQQSFRKASLSRSLKLGMMWQRNKWSSRVLVRPFLLRVLGTRLL